MPYPQSVDDEVRAVSQQVNNPTTVVAKDTLTKIVEFAHKTRQDENDHWPTLSTRNLVNLVCEGIEDGVEPKAAVKGTLWGVSEPYQDPSDAFDTVNDML
jgi:nitric oxide reductase NorQ protein